MSSPESKGGSVWQRIKKLLGRKAVERVPLRQEHIDWIFDRLIGDYETVKESLKKGTIPNTYGYMPDRPMKRFLLEYITTPGDSAGELYKLRKDLDDSLFLLMFRLHDETEEGFIFRKVLEHENKSEIKRLGSLAMKILMASHPEIVEDPVLKWAIDTAMLKTRVEIDDAVRARQEFRFTYSHKSVRKIYRKVGKEVLKVMAAMRETMIDMHFNFGAYGGLPAGRKPGEEEKALHKASEELFTDYVERAYGKFSDENNDHDANPKLPKPKPKNNPLSVAVKYITSITKKKPKKKHRKPKKR